MLVCIRMMEKKCGRPPCRGLAQMYLAFQVQIQIYCQMGTRHSQCESSHRRCRHRCVEYHKFAQMLAYRHCSTRTVENAASRAFRQPYSFYRRLISARPRLFSPRLAESRHQTLSLPNRRRFSLPSHSIAWICGMLADSKS